MLSPSTIPDEAATKAAEAEGSGHCACVPLPNLFFPVYLPTSGDTGQEKG